MRLAPNAFATLSVCMYMYASFFYSYTYYTDASLSLQGILVTVGKSATLKDAEGKE